MHVRISPSPVAAPRQPSPRQARRHTRFGNSMRRMRCDGRRSGCSHPARPVIGTTRCRASLLVNIGAGLHHTDRMEPTARQASGCGRDLEAFNAVAEATDRWNLSSGHGPDGVHRIGFDDRQVELFEADRAARAVLHQHDEYEVLIETADKKELELAVSPDAKKIE